MINHPHCKSIAALDNFTKISWQDLSEMRSKLSESVYKQKAQSLALFKSVVDTGNEYLKLHSEQNINVKNIYEELSLFLNDKGKVDDFPSDEQLDALNKAVDALKKEYEKIINLYFKKDDKETV